MEKKGIYFVCAEKETIYLSVLKTFYTNINCI